MKKPLSALLAGAALSALAACQEPFPPPSYYATPAPPPLQPYMGPSVAPYVQTVPRTRRVIRRRYVRRHYRHRVHCRCIPIR